MRPFEMMLGLTAACWAAWGWLRPPGNRARIVFAAASALALGLHLSIEGWRAQMVPAYALLGLALARGLWPGRLRRGWIRALAAVPLVLLGAAAFALPAVFPVFEFDPPRGSFGVGTTSYRFERQERPLVAQLWYPTAIDARGTRAGITTRPDLLMSVLGSFAGLPPWLFDHVRLIRSHAVERAPLAAGAMRFPVVLFSHGPIAANRNQSLFQMQELASHGFVVVAIDHTGYSSLTLFPDGHAVTVSPEASWPSFVDDRSRAMVRTWVGDVRLVIDRLEALQADDPTGLLTGRLDLSRIGYLGASFGGSVVVQALIDEPRIAAGLAQDGKAYFFDEALSRLRRPLMYMQSETPFIPIGDEQLARYGFTRESFAQTERDHVARRERLFAAAQGPIYDVYLRGTDHVTFSDLHRIVRVPGGASLPVERAHRIINDYTVAFFERYLNGVDPPLLHAARPPRYPEVTVAARNAGDLLVRASVRP